MDNRKIWEIALGQSALECGCSPEDFLGKENKIVLWEKREGARVYLPPSLECDLVSYGSNIVAQVSERLRDAVAEYIGRYPAVHCFETPNLYVLNEALEKYGQKICFMAEYFLPDVNLLRERPCGFELRLLEQKDFADLYKPEWGNALCSQRKEKDVLGVGAYRDGLLVGLAGASADCRDMYQIGIDVLPEYRKKGIASALTSRLALEILRREKVPFYCAAWSNIPSVRNATKCGFRPAWVQMTAREKEFVDQMNHKI